MGTVTDCTQADALIGGFDAEYLLAERGYDTNRVLAAAQDDAGNPAEPEPEVTKIAHPANNQLDNVAQEIVSQEDTRQVVVPINRRYPSARSSDADIPLPV